MNYILFDDACRGDLLPLAFTRPVAEFRIGMDRISEKWNDFLNSSCSWLTQKYLQAKYPCNFSDQNIYINGRVIPHENLVSQCLNLKEGEGLIRGEVLIAFNAGEGRPGSFTEIQEKLESSIEYDSDTIIISKPWDLFRYNGDCLVHDFKRLTKGKISQDLSSTNQVIGIDNIFLEEGAKVECAILNASTGPIYIGKNSEVMEGSIIRGPFALMNDSATKLGTKIYGPTTIGPHSKVGGELNNVVIFGFSNKAHDGFLGNAVLGEWCNLGADTNNSNLKNNYSEVQVWNYNTRKTVGSGLQFCGLIMGDHSKSAINTMFNTGTVVGVNANIFGAGFPPTFVPDFSWGGPEGFKTYTLRVALYVAKLVMSRRKLDLNDVEKAILQEVYQQTEELRNY